MPVIADFTEVNALIDGMLQRGKLDDDTFYSKAADELITEVERVFEVDTSTEPLTLSSEHV